jgi:hypothetical protein
VGQKFSPTFGTLAPLGSTSSAVVVDDEWLGWFNRWPKSSSPDRVAAIARRRQVQRIVVEMIAVQMVGQQGCPGYPSPPVQLTPAPMTGVRAVANSFVQVELVNVDLNPR